MNTIIAKAEKTFACPSAGYGKSAKIKVTAQAYQLGGNKHPHFSVTAEIFVPHRHDCEACGCLHEEAVKYWPAVAPIVRLHLSNADDGEPMYAEGNGWYDMAGALGGAGERYHRGNSPMNFPCTPPEDKPWSNTEHRNPTPDECLVILADHLRIPMEDAHLLRGTLREIVKRDADYNGADDWSLARREFGVFVNAQRARWAKEAAEGVALIRALSEKQDAVAA